MLARALVRISHFPLSFTLCFTSLFQGSGPPTTRVCVHRYTANRHALDPYLTCLCRYTGGDGVYTLTTKYERDPDCMVCSAAVVFEVRPDMTLQEVRPGFRTLTMTLPETEKSR